ncbi:uncharacterized protein PSFLO_06469 [Pseudozyma flocculosa]|uniref:Uncharacterized protein n=1 Tax=Pseudozyma flocculosa TaxID=84751 RepID=A0A5C3FBF8_9BASI|nr:uncharacterized protein PSFLO_06469 [Pseudozyma flocculosa]
MAGAIDPVHRCKGVDNKRLRPHRRRRSRPPHRQLRSLVIHAGCGNGIKKSKSLSHSSGPPQRSMLLDVWVKAGPTECATPVRAADANGPAFGNVNLGRDTSWLR